MNAPGAPLTLDTASGMPIYRQIVDWVTVRVAGGQLQPGEQLPTVRQMAVDLHVNYNTVARAYMELERMSVVNTLTSLTDSSTHCSTVRTLAPTSSFRSHSVSSVLI